MKRLAIIGSAFSGGAAQIIDAALTDRAYQPVAIFDSNVNSVGESIFGVPVIASSSEVEFYWKSNFFDELVIAIGGDLKERQKLYDELVSKGVPFATIIDKTAQIRRGASVGSGSVILANVFIGPSVVIGENCYVISNTCINHDSTVGAHSYFSTGCAIAGNVTIGRRVRFDTGSGAKANVNISDDSLIPAGKILSESV